MLVEPLKILVVNPISIFPVRAMNQKRTFNMVKSLSLDFRIDLMTPVNNNLEYDASLNEISKIGGNFICIPSLNNCAYLKKKYLKVKKNFLYYLLGFDKGFISAKEHSKFIINHIVSNSYSFVISNYWEISWYFSKINNVTKILDTHYSVYENVLLNDSGKYKYNNQFFKKRELKSSMKIEKEILSHSDIIVSISKNNYNTFKKSEPLKTHIIVPDGNDVEYYSAVKNKPTENIILFYGNLGSNQNIEAFSILYEIILPMLKKNIDGIKLYIVGANPSKYILSLHNNKDVFVTGYVDDIRKYLEISKLMILPMNIGSGFRGRIIEIMAGGVPVIGTKNALESVEIVNYEHGLMTDDLNEIVKYSVNLLKNEDLRKKISDNCIKFVNEKYSISATFDMFTKFLKGLSIGNTM